MTVRDVLKTAFTEDGTIGSYSRIASAAIVLATIAWVSFLVFKHGTMPDLTGPLSFLTTGVGVHMGVNKASEIMAAVKGQKPQ